MANAILKETADIVRGELGAELDDIIIERSAVGQFFTGVKLSSGHAGACATPVNELPEAAISTNSTMAVAYAETLAGRRADAVLDDAVGASGTQRAVGIATLNALAQIVAERRSSVGFDMLENLDAFDAAKVKPYEAVAVVGAFVPFLRKLRKLGAKHWVLEKDPAMLTPYEMPNFWPAEAAAEIVPQADVLVITGTTLLNDTIGDLITLARPSARIVVVGPTVTLVPDAFFSRRCDILGGVKVIDPDAFMDILAEGGSGYHFFGKSAVKVTLRKHARSLGRKTRASR